MKIAVDGEKSLDTLLVEQAYMLDAVFLGYLKTAQRGVEDKNHIAMALKAQRQSQATVRALRDLQQKRLSTIAKIEHQFLEEDKRAEKKRNYAERNEQRSKIRGSYADNEIFYAPLD